MFLRQSCSLDFNPSQSEYINVGDNSALDIAGNGALTIEAWVYPDDISAVRPILAKQQSGVSNGYFLRLQSTDEVRFSIKDASDHSVNTSDSPISTGVWQHIAGVWNGSTMYVYVNGVQNSTTTSYSGTPTDNNQPMQIGAFTGDSTYFDGNIMEVRLWSTARSQNQILQNMYRRLNGDESGLLAYYPLDENTGSTANDRSQNSNNGTLQNTPTWENGHAPIQVYANVPIFV